MDFSADRDSCDNLIEPLCITGHRFPHTNAKTGRPPSQQGFGVKKGDESQWMQCVWHMAGAEDYKHLCVLVVSALHGLALTQHTPFCQKISYSIQSFLVSSVVV